MFSRRWAYFMFTLSICEIEITGQSCYFLSLIFTQQINLLSESTLSMSLRMKRVETREIMISGRNYLQHLVDIAGTKHFVNISKLLGLIRRKIGSKHTILSAPPSEKLACCTRRGCTLFPAASVLLHACRVSDLRWTNTIPNSGQ